MNQLATFFGVSSTTVNNWFDTGRFLEIKKVNQDFLISDHSIWISPTGEKVPVLDIVERYMQNYANPTATMSDDEYKRMRTEEIMKTITYFESRYGGTFQQVAKQKGDPYSSGDWQWVREGKEWHALLLELGHFG